jgi:CRISPR-associated endoribonuclease Cas6
MILPTRRLKTYLSRNTELAPLVKIHDTFKSEFYRRLPDSESHDEISLYSHGISRGKKLGVNLELPERTVWTINFWDENVLNKLVIDLLKHRKMPFGMSVRDIEFVETPNFGSRRFFPVISPVLVKKFDGKRIKHLIYSDTEATAVMTATLQKKLQLAGLSTDVQVRFDTSYSIAKTALISINGIQNRTSFCPVIIEGNPESVAFAWICGVGHSTGCGFGALA